MNIAIRDFGPIREANLDLADLTVLVGPQATGKSVALQMFKLFVDCGHVMSELRKHGLNWGRDPSRFLGIYLGEGMESAMRNTSVFSLDGREVKLDDRIRRMPKAKEESTFFIPAQRVLSLRDGWPRPFTDYRPGDPFVVRQFSESLRLLMENELGQSDALFPAFKRLSPDIKSVVDESIFRGFKLKIDSGQPQKRLILLDRDGKHPMPAMVWSAGQREFVPLLVGLYWLMPGAATPRRAGIDWVILEEPEMGLHPKAISAVMLLVLELLARGYKVCISTHSPHVLDVVFAVRRLKDHPKAGHYIARLFSDKSSAKLREIGEAVAKKKLSVYGFDGGDGTARDISDLDPLSEDSLESGWGGLTGFSSRVGEIIAEANEVASTT